MLEIFADCFAILCTLVGPLPFLIGVFVYYFKFKRIIAITSNIASPPTWPIIGHGHYFIGKPPHMNKIILEDLLTKYGKTLKIWLGPELNIYFGEINDVQFLLRSTRFNDKAHAYFALEPRLKEGLHLSRGQNWYKRRKIITPAFHFQNLNVFCQTFEKCSRLFLKNLDTEYRIQNEKGFNIYEWINLCTLDMICETAMGVSVNAQFSVDSEYVRAVKTISTVLHKRMIDIFYRFELTYRFTKLAQEEKNALAILHGFSEKVIIQRREELLKAQKNSTHKQTDDVGAKRKMAFLDILLQSVIDGKPLTNLDVHEEVDTFMFEGHDTTSSALTFCFYNLAMYPECQQKCFEEIMQVFGKDKSKATTHEDLNKLNYIELCIKETLRLFPSVPMLGRKITEKCEIKTAMGVSVNAQFSVDSEYVRAVKTISTVLHKRMIDIFYRFELTYRFTKLAQEEKNALAILHGFSEKVIIQRREELLKAQKNSTHKQTDDVGAKRKMAFLDILLQSVIDGKPLTNLDVHEEVDTFMFEGHDTTSSALTFCFYNLAMYPECQQKCFEEIMQVFGKDKSKATTHEDLNKLNYIELCIKETLRLFPSVPMLGRKITEKCEINGKIIPAGTNIGVSPFLLSRQEELFPDAKTFKPERFKLDYATDKTSPYAYIPFSAGARNCIGQKFAMIEIKTILQTALRHYEFEYADDKTEELLPIAELILRPKDPLMFRIKPRIY